MIGQLDTAQLIVLPQARFAQVATGLEQVVLRVDEVATARAVTPALEQREGVHDPHRRVGRLAQQSLEVGVTLGRAAQVDHHAGSTSPQPLHGCRSTWIDRRRSGGGRQRCVGHLHGGTQVVVAEQAAVEFVDRQAGRQVVAGDRLLAQRLQQGAGLDGIGARRDAGSRNRVARGGLRAWPGRHQGGGRHGQA